MGRPDGHGALERTYTGMQQNCWQTAGGFGLAQSYRNGQRLVPTVDVFQGLLALAITFG